MGALKQRPPLKFRPAGAPAGAWHHTSWWHCTFYDPYERINVWSHGLPGFAFLALALLAYQGVVDGGLPLVVFGCCAATTHLFSAITHVYPDDHLLEKCDHVGIVALIVGTPVTALLAVDGHGASYLPAYMVGGGLVAAAFLRPVPRTAAFVALGAIFAVLYTFLVNVNLTLQIVLYCSGAAVFIRNGGHGRWPGLTDHHLLHYFVTLACCLHVDYIRAELEGRTPWPYFA